MVQKRTRDDAGVRTTGLRTQAQSKARAHSAEDKQQVRAAFIAVGRQLLASHDPAQVSLRRIATEAGYSPATIYQYFEDQRALFLAIREQDMTTAVEVFERVAARTRDPERRVRNVFIGAVKYWLKHLDHFQALFSSPPNQLPMRTKEGVPFGRSPIVIRSYALYETIVRQLFETYPRPPLPVKLATDSLIAATHGIVSFPMHTRGMDWSDTLKMAECVVDALLDDWRRQSVERQSD